MQQFYCKTRVIFGKDARQWLSGHKWERLLLVTDPYFVQSGWAQRIADMVQAEKKEIWDKVKPDPTVELAAEGTAQMRQLKPDLLVALGGGSAMDTAKAMRYFAGEDVTYHIRLRLGGDGLCHSHPRRCEAAAGGQAAAAGYGAAFAGAYRKTAAFLDSGRRF